MFVCVYVCICIYKLGFLELKQISMTFLSERHFLTPSEQSLAFLTNQSCSLFQVYQKRRTEHLMRKDMRSKMISLNTYGETILSAQKKGEKRSSYYHLSLFSHSRQNSISTNPVKMIYFMYYWRPCGQLLLPQIFHTVMHSSQLFQSWVGKPKFHIKPWKEGQIIFFHPLISCSNQANPKKCGKRISVTSISV